MKVRLLLVAEIDVPKGHTGQDILDRFRETTLPREYGIILYRCSVKELEEFAEHNQRSLKRHLGALWVSQIEGDPP